MSRPPERSAVRRRPVSGRRTMLAVVAIGVGTVLTGCAPFGTPEVPSAPPTASATASGTPTPTPTPSAAPVLVPDGTAAENLPLFTSVTARVWASADRAAGRAYIDALVAAGFEKTAMQVTQDDTTVGNPAESIQFSVRWGDECLVGQVGPATGDPVVVVVPVLTEGTCLVGDTRPIDW